MSMFYLYRHIRLDTGMPFYIGIGKKINKFSTIKMEYYRAFASQYRNKYWHHVVNKHDYVVEILYECDNQEEIILKEKEFITLYKRKELGGILVNLTDGGEGISGVVFTEESRQKISDSRRGKYHGADNPFFGKTHSAEVRQKLSAANKGINRRTNYKCSEETKKRISQSKKGNQSTLGMKHTAESKKKIGLASIGRKHNLGKKHTEESKERMRLIKLGKKPSKETRKKMSDSHQKRLSAAKDNSNG